VNIAAKTIVKIVAILLLNIFLLEVALSLYFFQRNSVYPLAIVHYTKWTYVKISGYFDEIITEGKMYQDDPQLGYKIIPNSKARHKLKDFDVTYTNGPEGERVVPAPKASKGTILFLGGSFTYGYGVENNEAFPYILGMKYWKDFKILNRSASGWATSHAYQILSETLKSNNPPSLVIYSMIPDTISRNYLRKEWLKQALGGKRKHPYFKIIDNKPVFQGAVGIDKAIPGSLEVRKKEIEITAALINAMKEMSAARNVKFVLVLLPQKFPTPWAPVDWPPKLIQEITRQNVLTLDLTEQKTRLEFFNTNVHPNAQGQAFIASQIGKSFVDGIVDELSKPKDK
jgi:hypothetical protein